MAAEKEAALNIMIIDDDFTQMEWYRAYFSDQPHLYNIFYAESPDQFFSELQNSFPDVVITDYFMPATSGLDILKKVRQISPSADVIISTSLNDLEKAVELMREGAYDILTKPVKPDILQKHLDHISEKCRLIRENTRLKRSIRTTTAPVDVVYAGKEMEQVLSLAVRCAVSDSNILIRGESGTGKELIAKIIHQESHRKEKPFITVNLAALPETLIESELFGHKKGAFTGSDSDRTGRIEEADGGTLFIDEAGDISPSIQIKLLRTIQFKEFQRVGENRTIKSDIRIIAATNQDLEKMIQEKRFREDLYFRLNVIPIHIPPLRDRPDDIIPLINHFLRLKSSIMNTPVPKLTANAINILSRYDYPGNVRELENIIEHALVLHRDNEITGADLPPRLGSLRHHIPAEDSGEIDGNFDQLVHSYEISLLEKALESTRGNQSAAARLLGITERRLRSRLKILKIENNQKSP